MKINGRVKKNGDMDDEVRNAEFYLDYPDTDPSTTPIKFYGHNTPMGRIFSNMIASPITANGLEYATIEHYFQAMKFPVGSEQHEKVRTADTAFKAKQLGRRQRMSDESLTEWVSEIDVRGTITKLGNDIRVMYHAIELKYAIGSYFGDQLIDTGNRYLMEDSPRDYKWGIGVTGLGHNMLGRLLMKRRHEMNMIMGL